MKSHWTLTCYAAALVALPAYAQETAEKPSKAVAQKAYEEGEFLEAKMLLEELNAETPDDPDILRRLAAVEAALGRLEVARNKIDRAHEIAPDDGDIQLARAYICMWQNQLSAALQQADQLKAARPDYPGLDEFYRSFYRKRENQKLRLNSFAIGTQLSSADFGQGGSQPWSIQRGVASFGWSNGALATIEVEREERTDVDTRLGSRMSLPSGDDRLFFGVTITPSPNFRETWSLSAGGEFALDQSDILLINGKFSDYRNSQVTALSAGIRHEFDQFFRITANSIHLFGGGESYRIGASFRADFTGHDFPDLFLILASYPDAEIDGTRQLRGVAGGARVAIDEGYSLGLTGELEEREGSYKRSAISLDLRWQLADR